ncbi:MAG: cyclic nucleotide-binding domain-containing protein [Thiocapsa sp.]|nr:cyclic nucleotide-binding domain-containing protein [Thiocapsa sp.]MCG6985153.1 cyclic nucleotide-binding domain-containing protein [Thiocapsa sp.]
MPESIAWTAFWMGILSACSLPLGALTTRFWTPGDRTTAMLMAFGGGALLAALTIDLVGSALDSGHFNALALGALSGGVLFVGLNQVVNDFGGFLRKTSTTLHHLRRQEYRRVKHIAGQIGRADLLRDLTRWEYKALAPSVRNLELARGASIYQTGDPADALYVIASGEVELYDPSDTTKPVERIRRNEAFGWLSCITGAPTSEAAVAATDVSLWVIPKAAIDSLVRNSPELNQRVHRLLRSERITEYLVARQGMDPGAAQAWLDQAAHTLLSSGRVPPALPVTRKRDLFRERLADVRRFPLIQGLPPEEQELILSRLLYKAHRRGEHFFHQNEPASRMFIIERGRVSLIDPHAGRRTHESIRANDAFGALSLLTGAHHTMTAVATEDTTVWELRRADLQELLRNAPAFAQRIRAFIEGDEAKDYLIERQRFTAEKAERWCRSALRALAARQPLPAAAAMAPAHREIAGAPLAIFLGITLDGIPESLVIGASTMQASMGIALLVGLFLSNYPEALSSSIGMRQQGMSFGRVVMMWSLLMLITGAGAAAGSQLFVGADPAIFALMQGLAAGAMLTMIAETMLPEAYLKGGSGVGLSTLLGFLVAIYAKTLEPPGLPGHGALGMPSQERAAQTDHTQALAHPAGAAAEPGLSYHQGARDQHRVLRRAWAPCPPSPS